ncbi:MAG: VCBS repeat-containing protein, partial [Chloroflexota bacterium]
MMNLGGSPGMDGVNAMKKSLLFFPCLVSAMLLVFMFGALRGPGEALAFQGEATPLPQGSGPADPEPPVETASPGRMPGIEVEYSRLPINPSAPIWTGPVAFTRSLAWGDYDLDGRLDLAVGNSGNNTIYHNEGASSLVEAKSLVCDASMADNTYEVAWGDYDGDNYLDLAVANFDSKSCVFRYDPGLDDFYLVWDTGESHNTRSVAWAGWNIDDTFYRFLALGNSGEPIVIYRIETGSFDQWWTAPEGNTTNALAWGDYNEDGRPDLAAGNFGEGSIVYRNDTSSLTPVYTTTEGEYTSAVAWGDMNGDGYLDLALANGRSYGEINLSRVYCNRGPAH